MPYCTRGFTASLLVTAVKIVRNPKLTNCSTVNLKNWEPYLLVYVISSQNSSAFSSQNTSRHYSVELVPWQSVDQVDLVAQDLVNVVVGAVLDDGVVPVDEGAVGGGDSIGTIWLEKSLEFWLEIPYTEKTFKNW